MNNILKYYYYLFYRNSVRNKLTLQLQLFYAPIHFNINEYFILHIK